MHIIEALLLTFPWIQRLECKSAMVSCYKSENLKSLGCRLYIVMKIYVHAHVLCAFTYTATDMGYGYGYTVYSGRGQDVNCLCINIVDVGLNVCLFYANYL